MDISGLFKHIVSITQFNKGKASQLFARANTGETLLVIKNNSPVAVILSPEEYELLRSISKMCNKVKDKELSSTADIANLLERLKAFDEKEDRNV